MKIVPPTKERRQSPRFKVRGMAIAVVRPPSLPPGPVKEISQSGLVYQYRENGNSWMVPRELDIIWADYVGTHHLEKMPVRIVSDVLFEEQKRGTEYDTRRQAVAFEPLTLNQKAQLDRLIKTRGALVG